MSWEDNHNSPEARVRDLEEELAQTSHGLLVLTMELEHRVEERTAELRAAQQELEKTNSELMQLTLELEDRVAERTSEVERKTEEVRAMSQQLWQAAKLATMGELAASIAHELNNPLTIIGLRLECLLMEVAQEDAKHPELEVIQAEIDRMGSLVSNLLQFGRRGQRHVSTLDIREEIEGTLGLIYYYLRNHRVNVVREFAADLPMINADRQQLRQLFLNLFTNAADASPEGGVLTIRAEAAGDDKIIVGVSDTGTGIPPDALARIFDAFFTTKPEGKGTGLGLPICHRIATEHGGAIEVSSEGVAGKGATFRVTLPLTNSANPDYLAREPHTFGD